MKNKQEKVISKIIENIEIDNREYLDYICYFLFYHFCELLNKNILGLNANASSRFCPDSDAIIDARVSILEKTFDYYNKISNEKNCMPNTISEDYINDFNLQKKYKTLEDYVLDLYKNNPELFNENEWETSNFIETYIKNHPNDYTEKDYNIRKINVSLRSIRKIVHNKGSVFEKILSHKLHKEFYIAETSSFWEYYFELQRYLNDVYFSKKSENTFSDKPDKTLTKRI